MAFDAYVQIPQTQGECRDSQHPGSGGWTQLLAFNHGVLQPSSGSSGRDPAAPVERCEHQDFSITKLIDSASPTLNKLCCAGINLDPVIIHICRQTGQKMIYMV